PRRSATRRRRRRTSASAASSTTSRERPRCRSPARRSDPMLSRPVESYHLHPPHDRLGLPRAPAAQRLVLPGYRAAGLRQQPLAPLPHRSAQQDRDERGRRAPRVVWGSREEPGAGDSPALKAAAHSTAPNSNTTSTSAAFVPVRASPASSARRAAASC